MPSGPSDAYILWTGHGLSCRVTRSADSWQVSVEAERGSPFLRRFAQSRGDAANQAEYLRVLLDHSRAGGGRSRERQPLVLIVEADPEHLFAYEEVLKRDGFRTASATSIARARQVVRDVRPKAVLLDHVLPDGDGPMFARELRASAADPAVPIVLVTGREPASGAAACGGGPDALLGKPCRPDTLTAVLKLLVQRSPAGRRSRRDRRSAQPRVTRARCPFCGIAGALVDGGGCVHCQQCGQDGTMERELYVGAQN